MTTMAERIVLALDCDAVRAEVAKINPMCTSCNGTGTWSLSGKTYQCHACNGRGSHSAPDLSRVWGECLFRGKFRKSKPSKAGSEARYLWRMVRFHAGSDCHLPMFAELEMRGNPYAEHLNALAMMIAAACSGRSVGIERWRTAMTGEGGMGGLEAMFASHDAMARLNKGE